MIFNSIDFWIFFPMVVFILLIVPKKARVFWLLCCSYYFYMCWNPAYIIWLLLTTVSTYLTGIFLEKSKDKYGKWMVAGCCVLNIGLIFIFKYLNFFIESISRIMEKAGRGAIDYRADILLPVGISYYTFQAVGYIIDVYRGREAERSFIKYALFVSFFPQIASGPIERSGNMLRQYDELEQKTLWDYDRIKNGLLLVLWGMFQKVILADRLALYVNTVYDNYTEYGLLVIVTATVLFAFQLYCDFDGYTNMACGMAEVMGITVMKNFKRPYFAVNIKDFWSRWHISLTSWFRDYLYIPLGGNRKGELRKQINVWIVFCVSGLWHGASWNYVIWGAIHGIMQVAHNLYSSRFPQKKVSFSSRFRNGMMTFAAVDIAWFFFRVTSVEQAVGIIKQMTSELGDFTRILEVIGTGDRNLLVIGLGILLLVDLAHEKGIRIRQWVSQQEMWFRYLLYTGMICACLYLGVQTDVEAVRNFIYFQF